jgi:hypothetical protein
MHRQETLPLDEQGTLDALWQQFPEVDRREVIRLYAGLMAAAARGERPKEESNDECAD